MILKVKWPGCLHIWAIGHFSDVGSCSKNEEPPWPFSVTVVCCVKLTHISMWKDVFITGIICFVIRDSSLKWSYRSWEMAQWLRTPATLPEDPGFIPSPYKVANKHLRFWSLRICRPLLSSVGTAHTRCIDMLSDKIPIHISNNYRIEWRMPLIPVLREHSEEDRHLFEAVLGCVMSSRPELCGETLSQRNRQSC